MNSKDKPMIAAQTAQETDKAEATRGEVLRVEDLDAVAGGEGHGAGMNVYRPGLTSCAGVGSGGTEWITCSYCGGAILNDPRYKHDCPAKRVPIRL